LFFIKKLAGFFGILKGNVKTKAATLAMKTEVNQRNIVERSVATTDPLKILADQQKLF